MDRLRIVLGNSSLADYPQGGGHWSVRLQYLLGLRALGHDGYLLELLWSSGDAATDERMITAFFDRLQEYGIQDRAMLLLFAPNAAQDLAAATAYGKSKREVEDLIRGADLFWNDCCGVRSPLLMLFRHRVLLDMDPGHLQVSALTAPMEIEAHHAFLTVGGKLHDADCLVPTLGLTWRHFTHFIHLPMWTAADSPMADAPFTSVTHWGWGGGLPWQGRLISVSKRDAYLRYITLPQQAGRPFELAANIVEDDTTGDRHQLEAHGWKMVDPWKVASSPSAYQQYIVSSRAEICCPKPVFRELKTGWLSDRSISYLATGRPVLAENTGLGDWLPTGNGLVTFDDMTEAVEGVREIDANYAHHAKAARRLAEEYLGAERVLSGMLAASG